jgi:hypothetical protein
VSWPFSRRQRASTSRPDDPNERVLFVQGELDGKQAVWMINRALGECAERDVYTWHLRIDIEMQEIVEPIRFPTEEEQGALTALRQTLEANLKASDNARLLGSLTHDGIRTLLYRVRDAERANAYLAGVVADAAAPRAMQYVMQPDAAWTQATPYFEMVRAADDPTVPKARIERRGDRATIVEE